MQKKLKCAKILNNTTNQLDYELKTRQSNMTNQSPKREILSNSRLNTAAECDHKYFIRYIAKKKSSVESSFFLVGRTVHEVIEWFYGNEEVQSLSSAVQIERCLEKLDEFWAGKFNPTLVRQLQDYHREYQLAIADTMLVGEKQGKTFKVPTMSKYFKENHEQTFDLWSRKIDQNAEKAFPKIKFRKGVGQLYTESVKCLRNFVGIHSDRKPDKILTEFDISKTPVELFGALHGGKIDRIEFHGQELDILDYKTGASRWDVTKVANEDQLVGYAEAVRILFPEYKVREIGIIDLLNNNVITHKINQDDINRFHFRVSGKMRRKDELDAYFKQCKADGVEPAFNVPAGRQSDICKNCDLAIDPDPQVRCKFYKIYSEDKK